MPGNTEECSHLLYYYSYYCAVGGWICMQGGIYFKYFFEFGPELKRILEMDHFQQLHIDVREQLLSIKSMFDALFILYIISFALGSSGAIVRFVARCCEKMRFHKYALLVSVFSSVITIPPILILRIRLASTESLVSKHYPNVELSSWSSKSKEIHTIADFLYFHNSVSESIKLTSTMLTLQMLFCMLEVLYPCDHCKKEYDTIDNSRIIPL